MDMQHQSEPPIFSPSRIWKKGLKEGHIVLGESDNRQGEVWEQEYNQKWSIIQFNLWSIL